VGAGPSRLSGPAALHAAALSTFTTFADLQLSDRSLHALERAGFEHPTPIQARAIPPALQGKDVIGTAATGTGKTAAFLLPIVERLAGGGRRAPRALVLAPTRELAVQIAEQLERFGTARHVRGAVVIGGVGMAPQAAALRDHEVIVATPGRLVDHLRQGTAQLEHVEILVLDEADRMLDMGFKPQLDRILARVPKKRQTLLFSATMAGEVADFARAHLVDPVRVEVARSGTTAERAEQRVFLAGQGEKLALLLALLGDDGLSTLVFTRTRRRADRVAKSLERAGHKVARIHADRSQGQRRSALEGFRKGTYRVLVATDIAARGIDVAEIGHVVNFDLPHVPEDYVHRVGRTARMAASGRASSFASPEEIDLLRGIERLTRKTLARADVPRDSEVFRSELARAEAARASGGPSGAAARRDGAHHGGGAHQRADGHGGARASAVRQAACGDAGGASSGSPPRRPRLLGSWGTKRRRGRR
jgi:ATP-dependent RNA helicase RhlE